MAKSSNAHEDAQRLTQIALFSKASPVKGESATQTVAQAYDAASMTGESEPEMNQTAMMIALRYAPYASTSGSNSLVAQNLTALRTSFDVRAQKADMRTELVRTNLVASTPVLSDHPVMEQLAHPAPAMVFKAHTTNDSDCLTQAVYYEARGEGDDGMRAVAQVILNRVRHPAFPKTICGVVYQGAAYSHTGCQFSFACDGSMANPVEAWAWRRAKTIAAAALNGYVMKAVGTATHFHTLSVDPRWSGNMVKIATIGGHIFYQFQGRNQVRNADGVQPSTDMPTVIQASDVTADGQPMSAPVVQASDTTVVTPQQQPMQVKPVTLAAKTVGRSAEDIIAAVALPQTAAAAPAQPAPATSTGAAKGTAQ